MLDPCAPGAQKKQFVTRCRGTTSKKEAKNENEKMAKMKAKCYGDYIGRACHPLSSFLSFSSLTPTHTYPQLRIKVCKYRSMFDSPTLCEIPTDSSRL